MQERDALDVLSHPENKPGLHAQLRLLIQRIHEEREALQRSLEDLAGAGQLRSGSVN